MLATAAPTTARAAVLRATATRSLHASATHFARRRGQTSAQASSGHPNLDAVMADMSLDPVRQWRGDGPSRYQQALVTEAVLVRSYLEKVKHEFPVLKETLNVEPYVSPKFEEYLRFRIVDHPLDRSHPMSRKVTLIVRLAELIKAEKLSAQELHALQLLAGPRYCPVEKTFTMAADRFPYRAQNKRFLGDTFAELLRQAKANATTFEDVPLDTRHAEKKIKARAKEAKLKFPKEWLLPKKSKTKAKSA
ncbi:37S ribosomal protein S24, mitochondrial [Allomyces arbusculus]|nr:37S ribosomal protein S24, mitochondrial [Allomyces arbusculus]